MFAWRSKSRDLTLLVHILRPSLRPSLPTDRLTMHSYHYREQDESWKPVTSVAPAALPPVPKGLRIVTYNVYFKGGTVFDVNPTQQLLFDQRMSGVLQLIRQQDAEIVCLQEVTGRALPIFLKDAFLRAHYYITDATGSTLGRYGVLILCKFPISDVRLYQIPTRMGRNLLQAEVSFASDMKAIISTVHLDSLRYAAPTRKEQLHRIHEILNTQTLAQENHLLFNVLCGDFNLGPKESDEPLLSDGWNDAGIVLAKTGTPAPTIGLNYHSDTYAPARFDRIYWNSGHYAVDTLDFFGDQMLGMEGDPCYVSDHLGVALSVKPVT